MIYLMGFFLLVIIICFIKSIIMKDDNVMLYMYVSSAAGIGFLISLGIYASSL